MPSEKVLQVKQNYVAELAEKLKKSACGVLVTAVSQLPMTQF